MSLILFKVGNDSFKDPFKCISFIDLVIIKSANN